MSNKSRTYKGHTIESNVPLPPAKSCQTSHGEFYETIKALKVGESFWTEARSEDAKIKGLHRNAKDWGIKVATRTTHENGKWGVRVWRIA